MMMVDILFSEILVNQKDITQLKSLFSVNVNLQITHSPPCTSLTAPHITHSPAHHSQPHKSFILCDLSVLGYTVTRWWLTIQGMHNDSSLKTQSITKGTFQFIQEITYLIINKQLWSFYNSPQDVNSGSQCPSVPVSQCPRVPEKDFCICHQCHSDAFFLAVALI